MSKVYMVISPEVRYATTDLSKVPAFTDGTPENTTYWDEMTKEQVFQMWSYAMGLTTKYRVDQIGSVTASEQLGALEDTYQDWVEEFEAAL